MIHKYLTIFLSLTLCKTIFLYRAPICIHCTYTFRNVYFYSLAKKNLLCLVAWKESSVDDGGVENYRWWYFTHTISQIEQKCLKIVVAGLWIWVEEVWEVGIRRKISFLTEIDFAILEDYLKALPSYAVYFLFMFYRLQFLNFSTTSSWQLIMNLILKIFFC